MKLRWLEAPGLPSYEKAVCEVIWVVIQQPLHFGVIFESEVFNVFGDKAVVTDPDLSDMVFVSDDLNNSRLIICHRALLHNQDLLFDMMDRKPGSYLDFEALRASETVASQ